MGMTLISSVSVKVIQPYLASVLYFPVFGSMLYFVLTCMIPELFTRGLLFNSLTSTTTTAYRDERSASSSLAVAGFMGPPGPPGRKPPEPLDPPDPGPANPPEP